MARGMSGAIAGLVVLLGTAPVAAQDAAVNPSPTKLTPASPQPIIPRPIPDLTVPLAGADTTKPSAASSRAVARHAAQHHHARYVRRWHEPFRRPALANVELLEALPRPPQPPHIVVSAPAYPLENFVTAFTTPPPPIVCTPTRRDRFKPDLDLTDETPVLCTADNP